MGWEEELFALFDELELQAEAAYDAEREVDLVDRSRAEYSTVSLGARLMASVDSEVTVTLLGHGPLTGRVSRVADGWFLLEAHGQDWIVRIASVVALSGGSDRAVAELAWPPVARLGLGSALRRLADSGDRCLLHCVDGQRYDAVVGRVGRDFAEVTDVSGRGVLVAFEALAAVQSLR